jgi:two-component sensor histidine kinase
MMEIAGTGWSRPAPDAGGLRADLGLAILLAFAAALTSLLYARAGLFEEPAAPWVWVLGLGLCTLPLALRRRYPVPVALLVSVGFFVCGEFGVPEVLIINICLFIALYTVGAWEYHRVLAFWSRFGIGIGMIAWLVLSLIIASSEEDSFPGFSRSGIFSAYATFAVIQIVTNLLYFSGAFYFGERSWRAARTQALLEARGRDPERAEASLEVVEESARTAVEELRQLVHTLRTPEAEGAASTVGIAQLPALIAESQGSGSPATLIVAGEPRPLPLLIDVALYRVVQEALTNVRKHAGRGASAEVRLRFGIDAVEVEVSDDGVRQTLERSGMPGSGLGLRGMRERVGAVGGEVSAGRRERGGFMVRARVPFDQREAVRA